MMVGVENNAPYSAAFLYQETLTDGTVPDCALNVPDIEKCGSAIDWLKLNVVLANSDRSAEIYPLALE